MEAWRGRSVQPGTPGLPPGPLAYATMGARGPAGVRPDAAGASMSPMTPPAAFAPPLLSTTAPRPSTLNLGATSSSARPSQPSTGPEVDSGATLAGSFANALGNASSGGAGVQGPQVQSAFELLGRKPPSGAGSPSMDTSEAIVKALTMAVSGERILAHLGRERVDSESLAEAVEFLGDRQPDAQAPLGHQALPSFR